MPSRMTTSARPCDSPAVRKRTIRGELYTKFLQHPARRRAFFRGNPRGCGRWPSCTTRRHARRSSPIGLCRPGPRGSISPPARRCALRLAPAGSASEQMAWNARCAQLANLRHPLINPLIDYGMAGRGPDLRSVRGARSRPRERGARAESLLTHAACFLEAHEVALTRPLADFVLRPISIGSSGTALRLRSRRSLAPHRARPNAGFARSASCCNAAVCSTSLPTRSMRPGREARVSVSIAGEPDSGLRTFRLRGRADGTPSGIRADCAGRPPDPPVGRGPSAGASRLRDWRGTVRRQHRTQRSRPCSRVSAPRAPVVMSFCHSAARWIARTRRMYGWIRWELLR